MNFDMQRFANDYVRGTEEVLYRGRRRLNGSFGRVWMYDEPGITGTAGDVAAESGPYLIFEIQSFEAKITADREDVIIGFSKDSKIVSLTGEGTITTKKVFTRGLNNLLESYKKGHDIRVKIVAALSDPDALNNDEEWVELDNVWFNEIDLMRFEKGTVVEQTIPFGFTPQDTRYISTIERAAGDSRNANLTGESGL